MQPLQKFILLLQLLEAACALMAPHPDGSTRVSRQVQVGGDSKSLYLSLG